MLYSYKQDIFFFFFKQLLLCDKVSELHCHILSNIHHFLIPYSQLFYIWV